MSANPKKKGKNKKVKSDEKLTTTISELENTPQPPNIFVYIQLANIQFLPQTTNSLEIHLKQGDSTIVKCVEHYNTDGIIYQSEFDNRPAYTLIVPQDNIDRINQMSNFPLLIRLYMRVLPTKMLFMEEEALDEMSVEQPNATNEGANIIESSFMKFKVAATEEVSDKSIVEEEHLELLSVGYIDLVKLFVKHRCLIKQELYLYSVPSVLMDMGATTKTEWHLYTLLPIIKEISLVNLAFIAFESIYNVAAYNLTDQDELTAQLYFRSTKPNTNKEYDKILFCEFNTMILTTIREQSTCHVFECLRSNELGPKPVNALNSAFQLVLYTIFSKLLRQEDLIIDYNKIDVNLDEAFVCNSLYRFVLTEDISQILFTAISCGLYDIYIEVVKMSQPQYKVFEGIMSPAVMAFPNVQCVRFAVKLNYVGPKNQPVNKKPKGKNKSLINEEEQEQQTQEDVKEILNLPTFAIIKICLHAPIGEISQFFANFNENAVGIMLQNCEEPTKVSQLVPIEEIRFETYYQFDTFIKNNISYIVDKCVQSIDEKKNHFCCAQQNLINILIKLVGADYNYRESTQTNVDFTNICVDAYNALELRIHDMVENYKEIGFENAVIKRSKEKDKIIVYMNTIKYLSLVNDDALVDILYKKIFEETKLPEIVKFYKLLFDMELHNYESAREFCKNGSHKQDSNEYFVGWIEMYLNYMDYKNNEDTAKDATELLLRDVNKHAEMYSSHTEGWTLLYCYYRRHNYKPGYEYARWHYEDHWDEPQNQPQNGSPTEPYSLAGIYLTHTPEFKTSKATLFGEVIRFFVRFGCFEFAQIVFEEIKKDCSEIERYIHEMCINVLIGSIDEKTAVRSFPTDSSERGMNMAALLNQINGSVEYYRNNFEKAEDWYKRNIDVSCNDDEHDIFFLSSIRLAYLTFNRGDYLTTVRGLTKPVAGQVMPFVVHIMLGRACYRLDDLKNALEHFACSTAYEIHIADVWAYLALINLRLGNTYNALECWKYAKIDPLSKISDEIYEELDNINPEDVELYIDTK